MTNVNSTEMLKTVGGIILGIAGIAICVGFLFISDLEQQRRALIEPETLCPVSQSVKVWGIYEIYPPEIPRRVAVVIDATDNIPAIQREEVLNWFRGNDDFTSSLMRFERVRIIQLDEDIEDQQPEFDQCAPPAEANPWVENPRLVRERFEQIFLGDLIGVVESLASRSESSFSPILEMVKHMFASHDRVILVSDLMHHVQEYSLYRSPQQNHTYEDLLRTEYADTIILNMQEKELEIIFLNRKKLELHQNETLRNFWRDHMQRNGGQMEIVLTPSTIN